MRSNQLSLITPAFNNESYTFFDLYFAPIKTILGESIFFLNSALVSGCPLFKLAENSRNSVESIASIFLLFAPMFPILLSTLNNEKNIRKKMKEVKRYILTGLR